MSSKFMDHRFHACRIAAVTALTASLSACAAIEASQAQDTEQLLAAAGFKIKPADTPEKMAHVQSLTQHKLVSHIEDGKVVYVFADASTCRCVYAGSEEAYQRYQQLALQKKVAEDQRIATEMNEDSSMNWGMWGTGPWWTY